MKNTLSLLLIVIITLPVYATQELQKGLSAAYPDIIKVRIFVGFTISKGAQFQGLVAPTVVTLIESHDRLDCRFVTFPGMPIALRASALVSEKGGKVVFEGESVDPRGWNVRWTAELVGNKMTGTFKQPYDEGEFLLTESYVE